MSHKNHYVEELIRNRRASKRMKTDVTVEPDHLTSIVESIKFAPSAWGIAPYRVIVVPRGTLRDEMAEPWFNQVSFKQASHVIVFVAYKEAKVKSIIADRIAMQVPADKQNVRDAYQGGLFATWEGNKINIDGWARQQAYIGLGMGLVAAADLEVDAAPYEGLSEAGVNAVLAKHGLLDEKNESVIAGIGLGKADLDDAMVHFFDKVRMSDDEFVKYVK